MGDKVGESVGWMVDVEVGEIVGVVVTVGVWGSPITVKFPEIIKSVPRKS